MFLFHRITSWGVEKLVNRIEKMSKGKGDDSRVEHDWDMSHKKKMSIEDEGDIPEFMAPVVDFSESERYVEGLKKFSIEEVGSSAWMEQHRRLEKLNIQAHQSAMTNSEEFVLESILTFDKLDVLIHDLLLIEAWKENVYPELLDRVAGRNSMRYTLSIPKATR